MLEERIQTAGVCAHGEFRMKISSSKILLVRSGALGDTLLTLPLAASIRSRHPEAALTFLGTRAYKDLLPGDLSFAPIDGPNWSWLFSDQRKGRNQHEAVFQRACVVLNRPDDVVRNLKHAGTTDIRTAASRPPAGKHLVEHLHNELGLPVPEPEPCLKHLASTEKEDLLWIHPGSGGPKKCLPLPLLSALAGDLVECTGWQLAITAGEEDEFLKTFPAWEDLVRGPNVILLDRKPLIGLVERLRGARLFIGNDSGIGHLAAGLGIPSAVFFVRTDPLQWVPWVPKKQILAIDCRAGYPREIKWAEQIMKLTG
jgi:heptosyltransferase III